MSDPSPSSPSHESVAVLGRLQAACASDTAASLMTPHMSLSCAGRLRSASPDGVVVEVPNPPSSEVTILGSAAAVTFSIGVKMAGFVAEVVALTVAADGTLLVTLALPTELQVDERRSAVRIPVPAETIDAAIIGEGEPVAARAIDISLTGILVALAAPQCAVLANTRAARLRLSHGDTEIDVPVEVCRRDGDRFGLRYRTSAPPEGLAGVIYAIQEARRPTR